MIRLDHYLTRKARRCTVPGWDVAMVTCENEHDEDLKRYVLTLRDGEEIVLAGPPTPVHKRFQAAREALYQYVDAAEARL